MDKDVHDKHYRVVGSLEALEMSALYAQCMPNDAATFALLDAIRGLSKNAVTSAMRYAEQRTAEGKNEVRDGK